MTRLRLSLKNSVRAALSSLIFINLLLSFGCTPSTQPTYLKESIDQAVQDICKKEYNIDVKTTLVGRTLWVYLPLENVVSKPEKPSKYTERFKVDYNKYEFKEGSFKFYYLIKPIPEQEKQQEISYNKDALDKINKVWKVLRRVLFSLGQKEKDLPQFFCLVIADIKKGFEITEIFYYLDIKKVTYEFISWTEYQHRTTQDTDILAAIIDDTEGRHLNYTDITLKEFLSRQIQHRISLKFQKPEVGKDADIDKEILKVVVHTLKTYNFKDFSSVELSNLLSDRKISLNQAAIWAGPTE